jgi:hypothetical protein
MRQEREEDPGSVRSELLDRLRALEGPQASGDMAEVAYRRAREALERALDEAAAIRLQAIEDARAAREQELSTLMDSMRSLRQSAQLQIDELLRSAELEAVRLRDQAKREAQAILERATEDADRVRAEAASLRAGAEARAREVERIEQEFDRALQQIADRLGVKDQPPAGWWRRLTSSDKRD